jgi:hypothetical protein
MAWTAMHLGRGCSLASNGEYQAFLAASSKIQDCVVLNPHLMIRVDVKGSTDAPPKKRGPAVGSVRLPLAALDSLLNGTTALPVFRTLADSAAKTTASRARAVPALPAPPQVLIAQVGIAPAPPVNLLS